MITWQMKRMCPAVPLPKPPPVRSAFCRLYAPCMRSIRFNQRRSCYSGGEYMEGEAIVFHLVWKERELSLKKYITTRFSGGKLDFSLIDDTHGFSLIDNENQNEFIDSSRKFEGVDWNAIATNGLDYKTYNKNKKSKRYFSDNLWKKGIKKFRIIQWNRCFDYVDNSVFMCWGLI